MVEAQDRRLGTCWGGWYAQDDIRGIVVLRPHLYVIGDRTLGSPHEPPGHRSQRSEAELVCWKHWHKHR